MQHKAGKHGSMQRHHQSPLHATVVSHATAGLARLVGDSIRHACDDYATKTRTNQDWHHAMPLPLQQLRESYLQTVIAQRDSPESHSSNMHSKKLRRDRETFRNSKSKPAVETLGKLLLHVAGDHVEFDLLVQESVAIARSSKERDPAQAGPAGTGVSIVERRCSAARGPNATRPPVQPA